MIRTHRGAGSNTPASAVSMDATGSRRFSKHEPFSGRRSVSQGQQTRRIPVSEHSAISPSEAADRLAIRELVEAYAHCADRRDANGQIGLFTADTHFVVFMNAKDDKAFTGAALTGGARSGVCRPEQVRPHHALRRT